jgi:polyferredoxin
VSRLLIVAIFFEVGVVLMIVPWSTYWERNYFVEAVPYVEAIATNTFVRGAITGLGIVNLLAGLAELASLFMSHGPGETPSAVAPPPAAEDHR